MSTTVDSRVVEMRFDNKEFEQNARTTINTLNDLKYALDNNLNGDAFEALDRAARNVDLSGIEAGIEALTDRFSTMGIVGMQVIQNITNAITGNLFNAINSITDAIVQGGIRRATNIENARFQLQGLVSSAEEVEEIMSNASAAVDGTAFSLDAAASAASQFAATGVQAGEEMTQALTAISGVAATTNSSYEDIARVFTTVAGNGRLMGDQLLQLSVRGLNAAASLRDYFNGVREGSIEASDATKELVANLFGAATAAEASTEAISNASSNQYAEAKKAADAEYNLKKKSYDAQYKELQKFLNNEYNAKKEEYDKEYKALQESLSAEIDATNERYQKRLDQANSSYEKDVENYRKATDAKIALIDQEYVESIKLIDEERYNRIKAIDDQIKAINDQAEAEARARELAEEEEERSALQRAVEQAKFTTTRQKAEEALAAFEEKIRLKRLAEQRQETIDSLREEKEKINEEANLKKQEAADKRASERQAVQDESSEKLKQMAAAHEAEINAIRKEQKEVIAEMQKSNSARLEALRSQQNAELNSLKEAQQNQLEAQREFQNEQLAAQKEADSKRLEELRSSMKSLQSEAAGVTQFGEITESTIRDMVSKGLISFDIFSEAMATTFGEHAYDANKTFQGAMSNIRSALARTGAMFVNPLIAQMDPSGTNTNPIILLLNTIREKINDVNAALKPFAELITNYILDLTPKLTEWVSNLNTNFEITIRNLDGTTESFNVLELAAKAVISVFEGFLALAKAIGSWIKPIVEAFATVFELDFESIILGAKGFETFAESITASEYASFKIKQTFIALFSVLKQIVIVVFDVLKAFSPLGSLFVTLVEIAGTFTGAIANAISGFISFIETSQVLNDVFDALTSAMSIFVGTIKLINHSVRAAFDSAFGGFEAGKYFTKGFLNGLKELIPDVLAAIAEFGRNLIENLKKVLGIHSPSTEAFDIAVNFIKGFINGLLSMTKTLLTMAVKIFANMIKEIKEFFSGIDFAEIFSKMAETGVNIINHIGTGIKEGIPKLLTFIGEMFSAIKTAIAGDKTGETSGKEFIVSFVKGMGDMVKALVENVADIFTTLFTEVKTRLEDFSIKEMFINGITAVKSFAEGIASAVPQWAINIAESFNKLFGNLDVGTIAAIGTGLATIWGFIKLANALKAVTNPFKAFTGVIGKLSKALGEFAFSMKMDVVLKIATAIGILAASFVAMYIAIGDELDLKKTAVIGAILLGALAMLTAFVYGMMKLQGEVKSATQAFDKIAVGIKRLASAKAISELMSTAVNAVVKIVAAIGALVVLYNSYRNETEKAVALLGIIGIIVSVMMIVFAIISAKVNAVGKNFKDSASSFTGLAAALYIIILGIQKITNMNIEAGKDGKKLLMIAAIMATVMVVIAVMVHVNNKLSAEKKSFENSLITSFAVLVLVTLHALKKLSDMGATLGNMSGQLALIAGIFTMLLVVMAVMSRVNKKLSGDKLSNMGDTILSFIGFLIGIIFAMKQLKDMKIKDYIKSLAMVAGMFAVLFIACKAADQVTQSEGYKSILAIGAIIGALVLALGVLSAVPVEKLAKSTIALAVSLVALSYALSGAGQVKAESYKSMIVMLISIVAIALILAALSEFSWESMLGAAGSIAAVLVGMGECIKLVGEAKEFNFKKDAGKYIAGLVSVLAIGAIIAFLSGVTDWQGALGLGTAISEVLLAMGKAIQMMDGSKININAIGGFIIGIIMACVVGAIIALLSKITDWKGALALATSISEVLLAMGKTLQTMDGITITLSAIASFIVGTLMVGAIGGIIAFLSGITNWDGALSLATAISEVLLAIGVTFRIMSALHTTAGRAVASGVLMTEGLGAVAAIMMLLSTYSHTVNKDTLLPIALSASIVLIALGATMLIVSKVGAFAQAAIAGIAILDGFIADLAAVLYILGELTSDPKVKDAIANGGEVLVMLGTAIGNFVGSIIGGIGEGIASSFPKIGKYLSQFMENTQGFFDGLKNVSESQVSAAGMLAQMILILTGAELLDSITGLLPGGKFSAIFGKNSIDTFGEKLASFGKSISGFAKETEGIDGSKLEEVAGGALALAKMASEIPNSGGLISGFTGNNDIDDFGEKLVSFAGSIKEVSEKIEGITNVNKITEVADAMKSMADMASSIPNSGGWIDTKLGSNDVDLFGEKLVSFSESLSTISDNFQSVTDFNIFNDVATAMSGIISMANDIPNSGGWLQNVTGDNDIGTYGEKLITFSTALVTVAKDMQTEGIVDGLTKLKDDVFPNVISLAEDMKDKFKDYKNVDLEIFLGDLNNFVTYLKDIVEFSKSIDDTVIETVKNSTGIVLAIKEQFEDETEGFGTYNGTFVGGFMQDLLGYIGDLISASNKAVKLNFAPIDMVAAKQDVIYGFSKWFEKFKNYTAGNIKEFCKDLKLFAKTMEVILALDFGSGSQMSLLVRSAKESKEIGDVFKGFKEYKRGKVKTFFADVKSFATLVSEISGDDYVVDALKVAEYAGSSSYLETVKGYFANFKDYSSSKGLKQFLKDFADYVKNISDLSKSSEGLGYLRDVTDATEYFINLVPKLTEFNADNFIQFLKDLKDYGTKGIQEFLDQFNKAKENIEKTIKEFLKYIYGEMTKTNYMKNFISAGKTLVTKFTDAIKDATSIKKIENAAEVLLREGYYYFKRDERFYNAGVDVVNKFVKGITDNLSKAQDAGTQLAQAASDASKDALDENSPSKAMYKVGSFAGEGFINGFAEWVHNASATGNSIGISAKNGLKEAIADIDTEFQNEYVSSPLITPVVDLSNVEDSISNINSMFDLNNTLSLAGNTNTLYNSQMSYLMNGISDSLNNMTNTDVIDAINGLREDMSTLTSKVANLQVVMDSGELVGAIVDPLDRQMGFNTVLVERGVR